MSVPFSGLGTLIYTFSYSHFDLNWICSILQISSFENWLNTNLRIHSWSALAADCRVASMVLLPHPVILSSCISCFSWAEASEIITRRKESKPVKDVFNFNVQDWFYWSCEWRPSNSRPSPSPARQHPCPTLDGSESIQDYYMRRYLNSSGDKGKAERAQVVYLAVRSQS